VSRNGILNVRTRKGRFAALLPEVCREKAVIGDQLSVISDQSSLISALSSVFSATGGPRFIFGAFSVFCLLSSVLRRLSEALGLRSMVYHFPGLTLSGPLLSNPMSEWRQTASAGWRHSLISGLSSLCFRASVVNPDERRGRMCGCEGDVS